MTKEEYRIGAEIDTTAVTDEQLKIATEWIEQYIKHNLETLRTVGITPTVIYDEYLAACGNFPIGGKAFAPLLRLFGLTSLRRNNKWYYVIFN